ncbi:TPA: hypothetical protein NK775_000840 [Serratia marcescens]|uniref:hypothetical protein n=1 Tax=Serratia marcescens TaxID=615 RepID=UPI0034E8F3B4|nr:hypothetical protein [Serratia marcescens]
MSKDNNKSPKGSGWKTKCGNLQGFQINDGDNGGDVIRFDSGGQMPPGKRVTESYSNSFIVRKTEKKPK